MPSTAGPHTLAPASGQARASHPRSHPPQAPAHPLRSSDHTPCSSSSLLASSAASSSEAPSSKSSAFWPRLKMAAALLKAARWLSSASASMAMAALLLFSSRVRGWGGKLGRALETWGGGRRKQQQRRRRRRRRQADSASGGVNLRCMQQERSSCMRCREPGEAGRAQENGGGRPRTFGARRPLQRDPERCQTMHACEGGPLSSSFPAAWHITKGSISAHRAVPASSRDSHQGFARSPAASGTPSGLLSGVLCFKRSYGSSRVLRIQPADRRQC